MDSMDIKKIVDQIKKAPFKMAIVLGGLAGVILVIFSLVFSGKILARVIDYVEDEKILVVEDKRNKEIRVRVSNSAIVDENNMVIGVDKLRQGFDVEIGGKYIENNRYFLAEKIMVKKPASIILNSIKAGDGVNENSVIYGLASIGDGELFLNLRNRRTGKYVVKDQKLKLTDEGDYKQFQGKIDINIFETDFSNGDSTYLEVFSKDKKGKVIYKVSIPVSYNFSFLRRMRFYFSSTDDEEKNCQKVTGVEIDDFNDGKGLVESIFDVLLTSPEENNNKRVYVTNLDEKSKVNKVNYIEETEVLELDLDLREDGLTKCKLIGAVAQIKRTFEQIPGVRQVRLINYENILMEENRKDNYIRGI